MTLKLYRDDDYESDDNDFDSYDEVEESTSTDQDEQSDDVEFETTGFNDDDDGANDELTQTDDKDYLTDLDINDDFDADDIENLGSEIDVNDLDDDNYDAYFDNDLYDDQDIEQKTDDDSYDYNPYYDSDDESDKNDSHDSTRIDNDFNFRNDDDNFRTEASDVFDSMLMDNNEYASKYYTDDLPDHVIFNKQGNVYNGYDGMLVALTCMITNREMVIDFLNAIRDARNVRNLTNDDLRNNARKSCIPSISQSNGLTLVQCPRCDAPPTMIQSQYCPICNVRFDLRNAVVSQDEPVSGEPKNKSRAKYYVSVIFLIIIIIYLWMA